MQWLRPIHRLAADDGKVNISLTILDRWEHDPDVDRDIDPHVMNGIREATYIFRQLIGVC
jgi:hypothetical protein